MAGAVFGEVEVSLFVAGAVFGEMWNDRRSAKCCNFQYKLRAVGVKGITSVARRVADDGFILGSWSDRSRVGNDVAGVFEKFWSNMGWLYSSWQGQYVVRSEEATCCSAHCK